MSNSAAGGRSPLGLFPGQPAPRLYDRVVEALRSRQHEADWKSGLGQAPMPDALARKYPHAAREWGWQWVFPASSHYLTEPRVSDTATICTNP